MIQTFITRFAARVEIAPGVWNFRFDLVEPSEINFLPGQYVILKVEERGQRNYSIASPAYQKNSFELVMNIVPQGLASTYLMGLKIGDEVRFQGPGGVFLLRDTPKDKIFLATGTGIAPIRSILLTHLKPKSQITNLKPFDRLRALSNVEEQTQNSNALNSKQLPKFYLFWGLKMREDVYFLDDFVKLASEHPNFAFRICLSREEDLTGLDARCFGKGRVDGHLEVLAGGGSVQSGVQQSQHSNLFSQYEYYLCGARPIVDSLMLHVMSLGGRREDMVFEKFV